MKNINSISVNLRERGYPVYYGVDILRHTGELLGQAPVGQQVAVISVPPVSRHYLDVIKESLDHRWHVIHHDVPDGERSKSLPVTNDLYSWLIQNRFERGSTILALGGGVVGDLAGFVAATYLRGVNLVQVPTSLLAQVDSSIGGKVGVNHPQGKNLIGSFYQPKFVLMDTLTLKTLPQIEFICGLGEVVKYALICNEGLYEYLDKQLAVLKPTNTDELTQIVQRCAAIKAGIVSRDEMEAGERALLNFGHTFGHALETYFSYQGLKHGQAVLLGMRCAIYLSLYMGLIGERLAGELNAFIKQIKFPLPPAIQDADIAALVDIMKADKKVRDGKINVIVIKSIGNVKREAVDNTDLLRKAFRAVVKEE